MKKLLYNPLTILTLTVLTILIIFFLRKDLEKVDIFRENFLNMQQNVEEHTKKLEPQKQQIKKAREPLAIEKTARNELLKQKEDEYILYITEIELDKETPVPSPNPQPIEKWQQLLGV